MSKVSAADTARSAGARPDCKRIVRRSAKGANDFIVADDIRVRVYDLGISIVVERSAFDFGIDIQTIGAVRVICQVSV